MSILVVADTPKQSQDAESLQQAEQTDREKCAPEFDCMWLMQDGTHLDECHLACNRYRLTRHSRVDTSQFHI